MNCLLCQCFVKINIIDKTKMIYGKNGGFEIGGGNKMLVKCCLKFAILLMGRVLCDIV